jgi:hypothetical protein
MWPLLGHSRSGGLQQNPVAAFQELGHGGTSGRVTLQQAHDCVLEITKVAHQDWRCVWVLPWQRLHALDHIHDLHALAHCQPFKLRQSLMPTGVAAGGQKCLVDGWRLCKRRLALQVKGMLFILLQSPSMAIAHLFPAYKQMEGCLIGEELHSHHPQAPGIKLVGGHDCALARFHCLNHLRRQIPA